MLTIARARAKFILSGEHFVVKGSTSIVLPAECFSTQVSLVDQSEPGIQACCEFESDLLIEEAAIKEYESLVVRLISLAAPMVGVELNGAGLQCVVKSSIPPGQGAGSSSALCQAIVEALLKHFVANDVHPNYLMWFGTKLENAWHGPVSGVDNAAIAYGRPLFYCRGEKPAPLSVGYPLFFVVGSTGKRDLSQSPYQIMRSFVENNTSHYEILFKEINENVQRLASALVRGDVKIIGECMNSSHRIYHSIGLSSPLQDEAIKAAISSGAFGARMTGAGCGGFVIALVSPADVEKLQKTWIDMGLQSLRSMQIGQI